MTAKSLFSNRAAVGIMDRCNLARWAARWWIRLNKKRITMSPCDMLVIVASACVRSRCRKRRCRKSEAAAVSDVLFCIRSL